MDKGIKLDIKHFKNILSQWYYYKDKLIKLEDARLVLDVKRGLHSVPFDRVVVQGSQDPLIKELNRLAMIDKIEYLDDKILEFGDKLEYIEKFIKSTEYGESIKKIHCLGTSTYEKEAKVHYFSERQFKSIVNKEIVKYLNDCTEYHLK